MSDWERVKSSYRLETFIPGLKKVGRLYKMCCPFHTEKTPSFVVNPDTQKWQCYGACQTGGDLFAYAVKAHGWTLAEALQELASRAGIRLDKMTRKENSVDARLLGLLEEAAHFFHDVLLNSEAASPAMAYLIEERGLSVEDIETWQLGYAPSGHFSYSYLKKLGYTDEELIAAGLRGKTDDGKTYDRFRHRIMFPIHDDKGRVRGFSARVMPGADDDRKYINSPASTIFTKSDLLYGLYRVRNAQISTPLPFQVLTIVEGQMDAIYAHKRGFKNVCAQMGTRLTDKQLETLSTHAQKIILCLDSDSAGQRAVQDRAREILAQGNRGGLDIRIASLGPYKDPDEMMRDNPSLWERAMENARPIVDVMIDAIVSSLPVNASIQEKTTAAKDALKYLRSAENPMETVENTRKLAIALNLPESAFMDWTSAHLRILPKLPPPAEITPDTEIPVETSVLWGITANMADRWLERVNAVLMCLAPMNRPMPYALSALSPLDFTHDRYQHLMTAILTHGDDVEMSLIGTPLQDVFQRVRYEPLITGHFKADTPEDQPRDSYEQFVEKVLSLRLARLNNDMEIFNLNGDARFMEVMRAIASIEGRIATRI